MWCTTDMVLGGAQEDFFSDFICQYCKEHTCVDDSIISVYMYTQIIRGSRIPNYNKITVKLLSIAYPFQNPPNSYGNKFIRRNALV